MEDRRPGRARCAVTLWLAPLIIGCPGPVDSVSHPPQAVCQPSAAVTRELTMRPQETWMWCWAACGQMIMEYHGRSVPQCEQANRALDRHDCCSSPVPEGCVQTGWPEFDKYGFDSKRTHSEPLSWAVIMDQLGCKQRPFALTWEWDGGGGHMMVASGYSTSGGRHLSVLNPLSSSVADAYLITYEAYVSGPGYRHWDDLYDIARVE